MGPNRYLYQHNRD